MPEQRCVAVCLNCGDEEEPGIVVPFFDPTECDEWITGHVGGTGHDVRRLDGWPHIAEAVRLAREQAAADA